MTVTSDSPETVSLPATMVTAFPSASANVAPCATWSSETVQLSLTIQAEVASTLTIRGLSCVLPALFSVIFALPAQVVCSVR